MTIPRLSYSAAGGIDSEDCVGCEGPSLNHHRGAGSQTSPNHSHLGAFIDGDSTPAFRVNHTCKHAGRDVHQIPLFSMTVDTAIACLVSILAPSGGHLFYLSPGSGGLRLASAV